MSIGMYEGDYTYLRRFYQRGPITEEIESTARSFEIGEGFAVAATSSQ